MSMTQAASGHQSCRTNSTTGLAVAFGLTAALVSTPERKCTGGPE